MTPVSIGLHSLHLNGNILNLECKIQEISTCTKRKLPVIYLCALWHIYLKWSWKTLWSWASPFPPSTAWAPGRRGECQVFMTWCFQEFEISERSRCSMLTLCTVRSQKVAVSNGKDTWASLVPSLPLSTVGQTIGQMFSSVYMHLLTE